MNDIEMTLEIALGITVVALFGILIFVSMELSLHRLQVRRLQAQRRTERECRDKGMTMCPVVVGLWPDLDEKEQLRDRIRELEESGNE